MLLNQNSRARPLAFSPDGSRLAVGQNNEVQIRDATSGRYEVLHTLSGHNGVITSLAFSPVNDNVIVTGSQDRTIRLWELDSEDVSVLTGHTGIVGQVAFSQDGSLLASVGQGGMARLWNVDTRELHSEIPHTDPVESVAFHPSGLRLATGTSGNEALIRVWNIAQEESLAAAGHSGEVRDVAVRHDGRQVASVGADSTLAIWPFGPEWQLGTPTRIDLANPPSAVAYSRDGRYLAVSSDHGTVEIWDTISTAEFLWPLDLPEIRSRSRR